jgi:hypothetical protein
MPVHPGAPPHICSAPRTPVAGYAALSEGRRLLAITHLAKELNIPSGITAAHRDRNNVVKFEPLLGLALGALAHGPCAKPPSSPRQKSIWPAPGSRPKTLCGSGWSARAQERALPAPTTDRRPRKLARTKAYPCSSVLVQREMERGRSPLVSIPPFGRGFSRHRGLPIRCGLFEERRSEAAALRSSSR